MSTPISGKSGGTGAGRAVTWKDEATPVYERIEVTAHGDQWRDFIRGRQIGWQMKDGRFISVEEAAQRGWL